MKHHPALDISICVGHSINHHECTYQHVLFIYDDHAMQNSMNSEVGKSVDEQVQTQAHDLLEKVPSDPLLKMEMVGASKRWDKKCS